MTAGAAAKGSWIGITLALVPRALLSPSLAVALLSAFWAFRRRRWWTRPPFIPLPDPTYLRWRMYTAYGDESAVPPVDDLIHFSRWRRELLRLGR
ncbi:MAG: hypothetical protein ACHQXA_10460 [Gemmatimonadales bacterium]